MTKYDLTLVCQECGMRPVACNCPAGVVRRTPLITRSMYQRLRDHDADVFSDALLDEPDAGVAA